MSFKIRRIKSHLKLSKTKKAVRAHDINELTNIVKNINTRRIVERIADIKHGKCIGLQI